MAKAELTEAQEAQREALFDVLAEALGVYRPGILNVSIMEGYARIGYKPADQRNKVTYQWANFPDTELTMLELES